ncbi:hypothetical protein [Risungbinella massiliensis]|uniref:hypothetical protein n=1 Tax=Risungbinella massiliensis TaxID=1329796 RepID=UPI0005CBF059|nr:hypothetical protein [Risungbinella massiliensis]
MFKNRKSIEIRFNLSDDLDREIWEWYENFKGKASTRIKCDLYAIIKQQQFVNAISLDSNRNRTVETRKQPSLPMEQQELMLEQQSTSPGFRARKVDKSLIG